MEYVISRLIIAMGMFIHDLAELKNDNNEIYTEEAYYSLVEDILESEEQK